VLQAVPHSTWLLPCVLLCGLIAALAAFLELRLQQLVRCVGCQFLAVDNHSVW
jgi:hypothetical protein